MLSILNITKYANYAKYKNDILYIISEHLKKYIYNRCLCEYM